uniref:HTH myb-type domain-containing protein n=1 Tax=Setaria italica TaxID=4555 RepID=K3YJV9_SETIT
MMRDGAPPAAPAAGVGGGGDGPRRCSQCGHHGHNARTCTARPVKLFGVRIGDKPMRKSASMGNLAQLAAEGSGGGGREEGYGSDGERPHKKRGEAWTEEEHKKFLLGLNKLGKGDWRGISRNYVISRTPTQVASHAQKYFNRQTNVHRRKRRSSLFDMVIDDVSIALTPLFSW